MKKYLKISILIDNPGSWFSGYRAKLLEAIGRYSRDISFCNNAQEIKKGDILFILSCDRKLGLKQLALNAHNIVVHASGLPKGRGWSPWTWQVENGVNRIPITLFEAFHECDAGDYYLKGFVRLDGTELIEGIRKKIAEKIISMIAEFLRSFPMEPRPQQGMPTYYPRRTTEDNELDAAKDIKSQFNKLRVADNERYPAYFIYKNKKYILKVYNA